MHKLAERTILEEYKDGGLLQGDVEEMMAVRLGAVFNPHGIGHLKGLDVVDVGGYPELLDAALANPAQTRFLVPEQIERFRVEDDIVITCDGAEIFTSVPRSFEETEALMAEGVKHSLQQAVTSLTAK
ncbi:Xaa-Pro dipeptidase [Lamellibrachia satsuma]|nr:Xaa-Pro dipeptidase [Lamellibrachia satsuma]